MQKTKFSGYRIAVFCFLYVFIHMGALNSLGVFLPELVKNNSFSTTQISLMFGWAGIGAVLTGMFITPKALKRFGAKLCMLCSTVLTAGHLFWYSQATTLVELYISATVGGIAIGLGIYAACGAIIGSWFVDRRLTILGIISAGSGLGSAVFNALTGSCIVSMGYRKTYILLFAIVLVLGGLLQLGIANKPQQLGQEPLNTKKDETKTNSQSPAELGGVTLKQAKKLPVLYLVFIAGVIGSIAWTGVNMYLMKLLSGDYGMPLDVATRYDAILRTCVAVALIFSGRIAERIGIRRYVLLIGAAFSAALIIICVTQKTLVALPVVLITVLVLLCFGGSHSSSICQVLANGIFGPKDFTAIQTYLTPGVNVGLATAPFIVTPLVSADGSVFNCFILFAGCAVLWTIITLVAAKLAPYKKQKL